MALIQKIKFKQGGVANSLDIKALDSDKLGGQLASYYRNATNINAGTLSYLRLPIATQAEAEAGTSSTKVMTPLRVKQAINSLGVSGENFVLKDRSVNGLNMNNVTETGFYYGYNMTNAAVQTISTFIVINYSLDWIIQLQLIPKDSGNEMHMRSRHSATTWSSWNRVDIPSYLNTSHDNESNIAMNHPGGDLYLNYRGANTAITKYRICNGTDGNFADVEAKNYYGNFVSNVAIVSSSIYLSNLSYAQSRTYVFESTSSLSAYLYNDNYADYPIGTQFTFIRAGNGEVSFVANSGVTLLSEGNKRRIYAQYQAATLIKTASNTWVLVGALKS